MREEALRQAVLRPSALWTDLRVVRQTGSTNADLVAAAQAGAPEGVVLVAEEQTTGRGRLGRSWHCPPYAGLTVSLLLRPGAAVPERRWPAVSASRYGWLPLLAGVALVEVVRGRGAIDAALKWPNDLLTARPGQPAGERWGKCAGILAEAVPNGQEPGVVVGIGLNVSLRADELPRADATSLVLAGSACVERDVLLRALLDRFADWYARWRAAAGDPQACGLRQAYLAGCATVGRTVRVQLPGGREQIGEAVDVDGDGRLVMLIDGAQTPIAAGDIVHVR